MASVYGEGGLTLLQAVVEDMFHVSVKNHIVFTQESFRKLMDMNGGMDMYVERICIMPIMRDRPTLTYFKDINILSSDEALGYMRYLDSDGGFGVCTQTAAVLLSCFLTEQLKTLRIDQCSGDLSLLDECRFRYFY